MSTSAGPSSNNASLVFGGTPVVSIDVQVPLGLPAADPGQKPYVDPQGGTYQDVAGTKSSATNATNTTVNFGSLGTGIKFSLPA